FGIFRQYYCQNSAIIPLLPTMTQPWSSVAVGFHWMKFREMSAPFSAAAISPYEPWTFARRSTYADSGAGDMLTLNDYETVAGAAAMW
ncbi:hypothetical protein, partial [Sulfobacillus harzensis]|uniref:hypothetical protein n=1 Tax=Sulfobacillus harzensis TaxID=2729629 RepID=UPI001A9A745E